MQTSKKLCLLLLLINFCLATSTPPQHTSTTICDKLNIKTLPFSSNPNSTALSPVNPIVICKSRKLYHNNRTSFNLFPASYTNYKCRSLIFQNLTCLHACGASVDQEPKLEGLRSSSSCILIDDLMTRYDPSRDGLNCSCDRKVHGQSSDGNHGGYKLRTRMTFDIPDHVPNICDACQKPNGNCGAGLRCICHPKECKNKVISKGGSINALGNIIVCLLPIVAAAIVFLVNP